ncbi:hypothetical protein ACEZ3G_16810 [Maribacter algicola]|uniref:Uncharacterized protein n=1 Tax=Meishania litoralis TaxID=3434685 RepID=A0ACC7LNG1_9FLAO
MNQSLILLRLLFTLSLFLKPAGFIDIRSNSGVKKNRQQQEIVKEEAFKVLQIKCNFCHGTKKRTDVFTLQNMDSLAPDIFDQVFVKKRMPKGKQPKLTMGEQKALERWLTTLINTSESND